MIRLRALLGRPITWVLVAALAATLFVFRDYGLTWDEPLFYGYADAVGYAYSPANWLSGHFDLGQSYGPSADDHKTRGPGYLLLARLPAHALQAAGLPSPDSWHLVNSLTFVLGIYFVYALARRFAGEAASACGALLFAAQPMLWGHAFINPKDMPFMVLFTGAVWCGWRTVDRFAADPAAPARRRLGDILLAAIFLGLATSNRILGPLAGLLVAAYWWARLGGRTIWRWLLLYGVLTAIIVFATWPYLWEDPLNFSRVVALMADNPTVLPVLFAGQVYAANGLPIRYLPFFLAVSLTEPVWPLAILGCLTVWLRKDRGNAARLLILLLLGWMLVPLVYVLLLRPPMYDGMRHFLFMLPPAFVLGAAGIHSLTTWIRPFIIRAGLIAAILAPGLAGIALLHPYEYTYFNVAAGGTGGAFRRYETDYWLTCYREAVQDLLRASPGAARLFVHREAAVAAPYAAPGLLVLDERGQRQSIASGDYVLVSTRTNEDLRAFRDAPEVLQVGRLGATFCVVRKIP